MIISDKVMKIENAFNDFTESSPNVQIKESYDSDSEANPMKKGVQWPDDEKQLFVDLFRKHGKDYQAIVKGMGNKSI